MEEVVRRREEKVKEMVERLRHFAEDLKEVYGRVTAVLVGSYARGDFNAWSDVDVLVVVEEAESNPLRRYDRVTPILSRYDIPIEPIIATKKEFERGLEKKSPFIVDSLKHGKPIIDELEILKTAGQLKKT